MSAVKRLKAVAAGFRRRLLGQMVPQPRQLLSALEVERQKLIKGLLQTNCTSRSALRVLFWEPGGLPPMLTRNAVIATALRLRGVETQFVICDGAPTACILRDVGDGQPISSWKEKCSQCSQACVSEADSFALPWWGIGFLVPEKHRSELRELAQRIPFEEIGGFTYCDIEVGQLAISSVVRYFKGLSLAEHEDIVREYLYAGLVHVDAVISAIARFKPDRIFMSHGCYVDYGAALSVALNVGIPATVWGSSYHENHCYVHTITLPNNRSYQLLSEEAWQERKDAPLTAQEDRHLDDYLDKRYTTNIAFDLRLSGPPASPDEVRRKLGLVDAKPVWCIFSHLSWDNVFNYAPMALNSVELWVLETIRTISAISDVTWLVKIHPAEIYTATVNGVQSLIEKNFPNLPSNVRIIAADSDINTYGLYSVVDGGVTVFGTPGLELSLLGKPVIVAGEAHYAGLGFTHDGFTKEKYIELLQSAASLPRLSTSQRQLARQYAYSYFIQRQIPFTMLEKETGAWGNLDMEKANLLLPGQDDAMDMICERVIGGGDFILE